MKKIMALILVLEMFSCADLFSAAGGGGAAGMPGGAGAASGGRSGVAATESDDDSWQALPSMSEVTAWELYWEWVMEIFWGKRSEFRGKVEMYERAGDIEKAEELYLQLAQACAKIERFADAADICRDLGDLESAQRLYRKAAKYYEWRGLTSLAAEMDKIADDLEIIHGKSSLSLVRDRRRFGRGQSAPKLRRRATEKKETQIWRHGKFRMSSEPNIPHAQVKRSQHIFDRAIYTANQVDDLAARQADQGSSKEPEAEE